MQSPQNELNVADCVVWVKGGWQQNSGLFGEEVNAAMEQKTKLKQFLNSNIHVTK